MNKYTQTAADLDGYEHPEDEAVIEVIAGVGLMLMIVVGLVWLLLKWFS